LTQRGADGWITRRIQIDSLLQRVDDLLQPLPTFVENDYVPSPEEVLA
jgi:hypothetical protein